MAKLSVRAVTRSARPGIGDWHSDPAGRAFLEVRVASPPVDGRANDEIMDLLAKRLRIARSTIRLLSGESARLKRFEIDFDERLLLGRLGG